MYTIVHAIFGYYFLLFIVRILSRRPGGQLTPFEFVIVFLIGGLIILATVGDDKSMTNCVCAILTIGLMHRITARIRAHSDKLGTAIDGVPLVLLNRGQWQEEAMHGMRIDDEDVMATARSKGIRDLQGIKYAIVERVGTISIIRTGKPETESTATDDGNPLRQEQQEEVKQGTKDGH